MLRLVVADHCNQEIANSLCLSTRTVESHRRTLLHKAGTRTLVPPEIFPVAFAPDSDSCRLEFGRELVCELRPHGSELEGEWRFGLHQLLEMPAGAAATVHHELRLFVYKPAGARVSVQLKTARTMQALSVRKEATHEGEEQLLLSAPFRLVHGGHMLWLAVQARRLLGAGQVLVTVDALTLAPEPVVG